MGLQPALGTCFCFLLVLHCRCQGVEFCGDGASHLLQQTARRHERNHGSEIEPGGLFSKLIVNCSEPPVDLLPADEDLGTMHVVYGSDEHGFPCLLTSMISLGKNQLDPSATTIHVVVRPGSMAAAKELVQCYEREMASFPMPQVELHELLPMAGFDSLRDAYVKRFGDDRKLHDESFVRLSLPDYLPGIPRALWLDTDTIVQKDLRQLYQMKMHHAMAAGHDEASLPFYKDVGEINGSYTGFGAGVMLVDLKRWRDLNYSARMQDELLVEPDTQQVFMNRFIHGEYDYIGWRYNLLAVGTEVSRMCKHPDDVVCMQQKCVDEAFILHMCGGVKICDANWLESRGHEFDFLFKPFTPKLECKALPMRP